MLDYCLAVISDSIRLLGAVSGGPLAVIAMRDTGIFDGDVLLVERAINPRSGPVLIAVVDSEFEDPLAAGRAHEAEGRKLKF